MNIETASALCFLHGLTIKKEKDLNHGKGTQLCTAEGPILSVYKTGKCVPGGKNQHLLAPILKASDRLQVGAVPAGDHLRQLESENRRLKMLLAERDLVIEAMKECGQRR
jgi:hypothetical protein